MSTDPTTIFEPDGRGTYYDTNYPWRCLCRIQTPTGAGSGVPDRTPPCVNCEPRHRLDTRLGRIGQPAAAKFQLHGQLQRHGRVHVNADRAGPIGDSDSDEDYAVLVLDKRLGDTYGWYGARTYDSAWDDEVSAWRNIGYPNDKGWFSVVPVYQRDFFLRQTNTDFGSARLIRYQTFDNWPGQSGSPVLFPASGTMAPTSSASYRAKGRDYNYISGGSLLPSLVSQARTEMP